MYRILHRLFGWDFVAWKKEGKLGFTRGNISRVRVNADGKLYYRRFRLFRVFDKIEDPRDVLWLTCSAKKYFK